MFPKHFPTSLQLNLRTLCDEDEPFSYLGSRGNTQEKVTCERNSFANGMNKTGIGQQRGYFTIHALTILFSLVIWQPFIE